MSTDRLLFPRPVEERLYVERVPVDGTCPRCGGQEIARYPVVNFAGPRMVTKCQTCFFHLSVDVPTADDHWPPWRSATRDWPASRVG
jgi:hypothetical protein